MRHSRVKRRYRGVQRPNGNVLRLWALVRLFRLSPSAVAKTTGFSRSYVARLLSPRDEFSGSSEFFRALEQKLPDVIAGRTSQFFTVPAVSVQRARNVLEQLPDQVACDSEMAKAA
jgi:hypothetical protein